MIRKIDALDKDLFLALASEFYHSEAVLHSIPKRCHINTFNEMTTRDCYLDGYMLFCSQIPAGYALLSKSFSPEVGGKIVWIEEIYLRSEFRGKGLGKEFFAFLENTYPDALRFRLEAEKANRNAIKLYQSLGFKELPYLQMIKDK